MELLSKGEWDRLCGTCIKVDGIDCVELLSKGRWDRLCGTVV